jgi:hypothetical protein
VVAAVLILILAAFSNGQTADRTTKRPEWYDDDEENPR